MVVSAVIGGCLFCVLPVFAIGVIHYFHQISGPGTCNILQHYLRPNILKQLFLATTPHSLQSLLAPHTINQITKLILIKTCSLTSLAVFSDSSQIILSYPSVGRVLHPIGINLFLLSSVVNPLIYGLLNKDMREVIITHLFHN